MGIGGLLRGPTSFRNSIMLVIGLMVFAFGISRSANRRDRVRSESSTQWAQGIVFEDINRDNRRGAEEPGIPNVRVSNGREITRTDAEGRYRLPVSEDAILFVIKPRDWSPPVDSQQLPRFYYIHKPKGSPKNFKYVGVAPTGPLPKEINFPLHRTKEPDSFKAILFGDPQPRNTEEVQYIAHDVVEQILAEEAYDASFGVTLGDIAFDDLSTMNPLNQVIALIGIPWYNVIGNHDLNRDAKNDSLSDETFERIYGPSYYSFDHGPVHFLVLDDVTWVGVKGNDKAHYHGGLGQRQLDFIRNDLEAIPENQLVVLLMHIPLVAVKDRQALYRLIEKRPATVSISAHTHFMEHFFIDEKDGWQGTKKHHHIVNVTVCGSWWRGQPDERGIPHATMSDGVPNGYSIMQFDGDRYSLEYRAAGKPAVYQMNIYAPERIARSGLAETEVLANVFAASEKSRCWLRVDESGTWTPMEQTTVVDPAYRAEKKRENRIVLRKSWQNLPDARSTPHMYRGKLPSDLAPGTHRIDVKTTNRSGQTYIGHRILKVVADETP